MSSAVNSVIGMAWVIIKLLNWAGVAFMVGAVVLFGRNLFEVTVRERNASILSSAIWRQSQAQFAFLVFSIGVAAEAFSILVAITVPGRS